MQIAAIRSFAFVLASVLLMIAPAHASEKILDIKTVTSPGGITAWLVEDHNVPVIAVEFGFRGAGTVNDPADKQGLIRLLSNTLDEGAGAMDAQAFQKELADRAISLSFGASRDHFTGALKTLRAEKDKAFELLALALTQPRFDAEAVERMRAANIARIRESLSDPDWIATRLLYASAFSGHAYARNSGGTLSGLAKITPDDLRAAHKTLLGRHALMIGVAGDITAAELAPLLDRVFGAMPVVTPPAAPAETQITGAQDIRVYDKMLPQSAIQVIQPGIKRADPAYAAAEVVNFTLGGSGFGARLMESVREKRGLSYGISSGFLHLDKADGLMISTSTKNANVAQVIDLIRQELRDVSKNPITAQELKNAQTYLTGALPLSLTSTNAIAGLLLSLQEDGLPITALEDRDAKLRALSLQDVNAMAARLLRPDDLRIVVVGQPRDLKNATVVKDLPDVE
ncbi:MAG: insulinase family protein [Alphaproteobacteria bacterium]|nr:insulinase family protein [Alphaproteobacteria bacterium]